MTPPDSGERALRIFLVRYLFECSWPDRAFDLREERVVSDSPSNALAVIEKYRTQPPAPLQFTSRIVADLGPYRGAP